MSNLQSSSGNLSLTGKGIWRGQNKSNGQLEKINSFDLSVGYSGLTVGTALAAELAGEGVVAVPFGNAVWYDRNVAGQTNHIYAGVPTAGSAKPKLAGIIKYDPALTSMQPANSLGLMDYNKGTIVKRGFVRYKTAKVAASGAVRAFADIDDTTMKLFFENSTGDPVIATPTSWGTAALTGLTDVQKAALIAALETHAVTLPTLTGDTTVPNLITHLSAVVLATVGLDAPTAAAVGALLQSGSMVLTGAHPTLTGCTYGGDIVNVYPEDESVLVELRF